MRSYSICLPLSESESHSIMSDSLGTRGLHSPWNSLSQNTGMGSPSLLQGIFPTQGSNPGLPHCRQILYQLSYQGSPWNKSSVWLISFSIMPSRSIHIVTNDRISSFLCFVYLLLLITHMYVYIHMGFPGGAVIKNLPASSGDTRDLCSIPGLGRSPGAGNDNSLQDSCLKKSMEVPGLLQFTGSQRAGHYWAPPPPYIIHQWALMLFPCLGYYK